MKISDVGDSSKPLLHIWSNSSRLYAIPPPDPPIVKLGLSTQGNPILSRRTCASSDAGSKENPDSLSAVGVALAFQVLNRRQNFHSLMSLPLNEDP